MNATKEQIKRKEEQINYYNSKRQPIMYNSSNHFYYLLENYKKYLVQNNYSKQAVYIKERQCIEFLNYIEQNKITDISNLSITTIENFLKSIKTDLSLHTKKGKHNKLRVFLRFLYHQQYISFDLSKYVPTIKISSHATIPSAWSEDNIKKLFSAIDRDNTSDKKIYAILLLAIKYGLRVSDIKNLKFENIDWLNKRITIIQVKTKKQLILPLLPEVADGLIDYIKNARPRTESKHIFVKKNGEDFDQKIQSKNFYTEICELIKKANIDIPKYQKKGIHSLRHTLASSMLKENIPLPIITSILGQSTTMSSVNYTKVDLNMLKQCCLSLEVFYE